MNRPTRLLSLALTLWAAHAVLPGAARAELLPFFSTDQPTLSDAGYSYRFDVQFAGGKLSAGDTLTFLDIPTHAGGAAPGIPFDVTEAPTLGDPGHEDVTFTWIGPDLTSNQPIRAPGLGLFTSTLTSAAPLGYFLDYRSRVGLTPDEGDQFAYFGVAALPTPEPAGVVLMGLGGLGIAGVAWRRGRQRRSRILTK